MKREIKRYALVWLALMALLALTAGSAYLRMGAWNAGVNLGIAVIKALLVGMFFMHVNKAQGIIRICISVALLTLALLFVISGSDYATREMHAAPWQMPAGGAAGQRR